MSELPLTTHCPLAIFVVSACVGISSPRFILSKLMSSDQQTDSATNVPGLRWRFRRPQFPFLTQWITFLYFPPWNYPNMMNCSLQLPTKL